MNSHWSKLILKNFGNASGTYNQEAKLQRKYAWLVAEKCSKESIPEGIWADLGSGTGLLAEALETLHPNQSVLRVDASKEMLVQHQTKSHTQLWDLNLGLPTWSRRPALLASSFALHWLSNPSDCIQEWLTALTPGGLLAIALPVKGSFQEWHFAAEMSGIRCTAMQLPSQESILKHVDANHIRYQKLHIYTDKASKVSSLLKPIIKVGAQSTPQFNLKVGEWKELQKAWPRSSLDNTVNLSWLIQLLLVQR